MNSHPLFFLKQKSAFSPAVALFSGFYYLQTRSQFTEEIMFAGAQGRSISLSHLDMCNRRAVFSYQSKCQCFQTPHTLRNTTVRLPDIPSSFSASWKAWKQLITLHPRAGEVGWINLCLKENLGGCFLFCPPQKSFMHDEISHQS